MDFTRAGAAYEPGVRQGEAQAGRLCASGPAELLAHPAVDPFSQEVGVAAMAGLLLDHVDQDFP